MTQSESPPGLLGRPIRIALVATTVVAVVVVLLGVTTPVFAATAEPGAAAAEVRPVRILIPRIGVDAPVRPVGLMPSGEIEVPPLAPRNLTGWYKYGPVPGSLGPAVIVGHRSTRSGPSVFARAARLRRGDAIRIVRSDGVVAVFTVDRLEQVRKTEFPTERVYGNLDRPGLRLITCAGDFDRRTGAHTDNLIVYASMRPATSI
ncbi:class F sortase [Sphaerisporangium album]|uniref:Class F sortase n=1 Tax=Sphaerisporangium album TaxID=509200 RepID=A0A367FM61_9ACTN|nr:class F sortase [Sphaerisporangium album]RCG30989.1 class F sortase [Sphaerisporangium album]